MRKPVVFLNLLFSTLILSSVAIVVSLFDRSGDRIWRIARFWSRLHLRVCGIRVLVTGLERLSEPPYILMGNHQSALDIFALLAAVPFSIRWVAKRELFAIPVFGWAIRRGGYISLDRAKAREAVKAMEEAVARIRKGVSVVIFPEGTRSPTGALLPFKKGSFSLLFKAGVPAVPVGIWGSGRLQPPGSSVPVKGGTIRIGFGAPMAVAEKTPVAREHLTTSVRTAIEELMAEGGRQEKEASSRDGKEPPKGGM
jgi:1-acyl-sn-glycerol-3-phosphate acyltransferase